MFKEPAEPSMFDDIQTVVFASPDKIGKVFCVLDETMRLCLICDGAFTRQGAAEHANVACSPAPMSPPQKLARLTALPDPARSVLRQ
jgi:hypothetical protein